MEKIKKILLILIMIILAGAIITSKISLAAVNDTVNLKAISKRGGSSGWAYSTLIDSSDSRKVQKIIRTSGGTEAADNNAIYYCVGAGVGFGAGDDPENLNESAVTEYTNRGDYTNSSNKLMYLLDHLYTKIGDNNTSARNQFITSIIGSGNDLSEVNDHDVDVVQQLAIWHFTNPGTVYDYYDGTGDELNELIALTLRNGSTVEYLSFNNNAERMDTINKLYEGLITKANENPSYTRSGGSSSQPSPVSGTMSIFGSDFISEAYTMPNTNAPVDGIVIKDGNNTDISNKVKIALLTDPVNLTYTKYSVSDSNLWTNIKGKTVYFIISAADAANINEINVEFTTVEDSTYRKLTSYTTGSNSEQPIVKIEPGTIEKTYRATYTLERLPDLALRKYITTVQSGENAATGRTVLVDASDLNKKSGNDTITTATYKHAKNPISVKVGDKVTYKITIYNEGLIAGRATEIKDQLPDGLSFDSVVSGDYTANYNSSTNLVTFSKTSTVDLAAYACDGSTPVNETIEFKCTVVNSDQLDRDEDNILTNIAWISGDSFSTPADRDSQPTTPTIPDLVTQDPDTGYKGNGNKDELNDGTYYYKGQQDDDDFEKVILPARGKTYYDLKLQKVDARNKVIEKNSTFKIDDNNVTVTNGVYNFERKTVVSEGTDVYTITEVTAPDKYIKFDGKIELTINKEYVAETEEYKATSYTYRILDNNNTDITEASGSNVVVSGPVLDENNVPSFTIKVVNKQFDLALRKFITKVGSDSSFDNRVPTITSDEKAALYNKSAEYDNGTTAEKTHEKDAVTVNSGDIVKYTIRVYNEGDVPGKATKVTDYLPTGLTLKARTDAEGDINTTYDWQTEEGNDRIVYTTYLSDKVIQPATNSEVNYRDLEIECVVTQTPSETEQYSLKNIAAITGATDENGNTVTDADSNPTNLSDDERNPYNPVAPENGKGIQDDDDYEELIMLPQYFDLALRKYIVGTGTKGGSLASVETLLTRGRIPDIDKSTIYTEKKTATYKHRKDPVTVTNNSLVMYEITVYNEGTQAGYPMEIIDQLPEGMIYHSSSSDNYTYVEPEEGDTSNQIKFVRNDGVAPLAGFNGTTLASETINVTCQFLDKADDPTGIAQPDIRQSKIFTNIAWISKEYNSDTGEEITTQVGKDRDSEPANAPQEDELLTKDEIGYTGNEANKEQLDDETYHYAGLQDDDDFEKVIMYPEGFDLALLKRITKVNDDTVDKIESIDVSKLNTFGEDGKLITTGDYKLNKDPVLVKKGDIVTYTFRIYNEGMIPGYAAKITDDLPDGLKLLVSDKTDAEIDADQTLTTLQKKAIKYNNEHLWTEVEKEEEGQNGRVKVKYIETTYFAKDEQNPAANLLEAFGRNDGTKTEDDIDSLEISVMLEVTSTDTTGKIIRNEAAITEYQDYSGGPIEDRDSQDNVWEKYQDDEDYDNIKLSQFDLALRKFISGVDDIEVKDREPKPNTTGLKNGTAKTATYEHTKEPILVSNGQVVTYTIRVYNEGEIDGYAASIRDDIPEGLQFLPDEDVNIKYGWTMFDSEGMPTTDPEKAKTIETYYRSKASDEARIEKMSVIEKDGEKVLEKSDLSLIEAYDPVNDKLDYTDVKVAFLVTAPASDDRIVINHAQVENDTDKDGNDVTDRDSTPGEWLEEDDEDIEKLKVQIFDLALRKWITETIVDDGNNVTTTETGHKAEDDPESIVKVEIKDKKLKTVKVKFRYKIRVTNEGTIPGYAKKIKDYIPDGLKFVKEDNPTWKYADDDDDAIETEEGKDVLLQPGESIEVEVLLTWINGNDNLGLKENVAEISEDYNEYGAPDVDSTPNNRKDEDDIDDAPVLLSIKTGQVRIYFSIIGGFLILILAGVVFIKKYVI